METFDPQQHTRKITCLEILFPLFYNPQPDDPLGQRRRIPPKHHRQTFKEIEQHFRGRIDGWSMEHRSKPTQGTWKGIKDDSIRFFLDGDFSQEDFGWVWGMKHQVWQDRFEQIVIYVKYSEATEIL